MGEPRTNNPALDTAIGGSAQGPEIRDLPLPEGFSFFVRGLNGAFTGKRFMLKRARTVLGRSDTDVILEDPSISRRHCAIEIFDPDFALLKDLASTNGTRLNGALINDGKLKPGDRLQIGDCEFEYQVEKTAA